MLCPWKSTFRVGGKRDTSLPGVFCSVLHENISVPSLRSRHGVFSECSAMLAPTLSPCWREDLERLVKAFRRRIRLEATLVPQIT